MPTTSFTPTATPVARDPISAAPQAPVAASTVTRPDPAKSKAVNAPDPKQMASELNDALQQLNESMRNSGRNLAFNKDEASGRTVIRVTNTDTGELVRQIPTEEFLKVARAIDAFKGNVLDQNI